MENKLPTLLNKSPLIDAVFECRFDADIPMSNVLPGFIISNLKEESYTLERLPQADIPIATRDQDPNLKFAPLCVIKKKHFALLIGDKSVALTSILPYSGWDNFRSEIVNLMAALNNTKLLKSIERYSTKYTSIIKFADLKTIVNPVNIKLNIGNIDLYNEAYQIHTQLKQDDFVNIIQIFSKAQTTLPDGNIIEGLVIDIDIIEMLKESNTEKILSSLLTRLDLMHDLNKKTFINCLSTEVISFLEPVYD